MDCQLNTYVLHTSTSHANWLVICVLNMDTVFTTSLEYIYPPPPPPGLVS